MKINNILSKSFDFVMFCLIPWMVSFFFIPVFPEMIARHFGISEETFNQYFGFMTGGSVLIIALIIAIVIPGTIDILRFKVFRTSSSESSSDSCFGKTYKARSTTAIVSSFGIGIMGQVMLYLVIWFLSGSGASNDAFFTLMTIYLLANAAMLLNITLNPSSILD